LAGNDGFGRIAAEVNVAVITGGGNFSAGGAADGADSALGCFDEVHGGFGVLGSAGGFGLCGLQELEQLVIGFDAAVYLLGYSFIVFVGLEDGV